MIGNDELILQSKGIKNKSVSQFNEHMKSVIKSINTPPDFDDELKINDLNNMKLEK